MASSSPAAWPLPDRVGFGEWMWQNLNAKAAKGVDGKVALFKHQQLVRAFLQPSSPYRGLLLYHGLGTGKSLSAVAIAESLRTEMPVMVMLPASLHQNFEDEVAKFASGTTNVTGASAAGAVGKYEYVHYNGGLTRTKLKAGGQLSPAKLSGKAIIIDEAHNFCAAATHPSTLIAGLYANLMAATGVKLILLTGTPVINTPFELSRMMNLLRGPQTVHRLHLDDPSLGMRKLSQDPAVDAAWQDPSSAATLVTLLPDGFERVPSSSSSQGRGPVLVTKKVESGTNGSKHDIQAVVRRALPPAGLKLLQPVSSTQELCLPDDPVTFFETFVGEHGTGGTRMREQDLFIRRIQGLVSHFSEYDASIYPRVGKMEVVRLPMTDTQFRVYRKARDYEIKQERQAKMREARSRRGASGTNGDDSNNGVYKAFSRAACNFAFPPEVARPYPKDIRDDSRESNSGPEGSQGKTKAKAVEAAYEAQLERAMDKLDLSMERVQELAPKFVEVHRRAKAAPGPVLVYTDFRKVEGVRLLAAFLERNGWTQYSPEQAGGGGDHSRKTKRPNAQLLCFAQLDTSLPLPLQRQLLDLYNNADRNLRGQAVKMLIVTRSGAEGLTLKNVRQVHILEPYWHAVRLQQIIGRAVRAHSHAALPDKADREVEVFLYLMQLTRAQAQDPLLQLADQGLSTDEMVYAAAQRKDQLIQQFLTCLQRAAVDCHIHQDSAAKGAKKEACYSFPAQLPPSALAFVPKLGADKQHGRRAELAAALGAPKTISLGPERFKNKGKVLARVVFGATASKTKKTKEGQDEGEDVLVDVRAFEKLGRLMPVGFLLREGRGGAPSGVLEDEGRAADVLFGSSSS